MDFLKDLATDSQVPAGGAAAAYTTSLAIGLLYKTVLSEMHRREDVDGIIQNMMVARKELEKLLRDTQGMIKEDCEASLAFSASYKDPEHPGIKQHFSRVLDVSMAVHEKACLGLEWVRMLAPMVPTKMTTNLNVAAELLLGAANATIHVARDNVQKITNVEKRDNFMKRLAELHAEAETKYEKATKALKEA